MFDNLITRDGKIYRKEVEVKEVDLQQRLTIINNKLEQLTNQITQLEAQKTELETRKTRITNVINDSKR